MLRLTAERTEPLAEKPSASVIPGSTSSCGYSHVQGRTNAHNTTRQTTVGSVPASRILSGALLWAAALAGIFGVVVIFDRLVLGLLCMAACGLLLSWEGPR